MYHESKLIKTELGLLNLADHLHNVTQACKLMGYSRDGFYRIKQSYDTGGAATLLEISRSKSIVKNRLHSSIESVVVKMAFDYPGFSECPASNELRKHGVIISVCGVRSVWQRHNLEVFDKRLKALEARVHIYYFHPFHNL